MLPMLAHWSSQEPVYIAREVNNGPPPANNRTSNSEGSETEDESRNFHQNRVILSWGGGSDSESDYPSSATSEYSSSGSGSSDLVETKVSSDSSSDSDSDSDESDWFLYHCYPDTGSPGYDSDKIEEVFRI